ncbi:hypothetical protein GCM10025784_14410 [Citricoccus nitrophenolicus]
MDGSIAPVVMRKAPSFTAGAFLVLWAAPVAYGDYRAANGRSGALMATAPCPSCSPSRWLFLFAIP